LFASLYWALRTIKCLTIAQNDSKADSKDIFFIKPDDKKYISVPHGLYCVETAPPNNLTNLIGYHNLMTFRASVIIEKRTITGVQYL